MEPLSQFIIIDVEYSVKIICFGYNSYHLKCHIFIKDDIASFCGRQKEMSVCQPGPSPTVKSQVVYQWHECTLYLWFWNVLHPATMYPYTGTHKNRVIQKIQTFLICVKWSIWRTSSRLLFYETVAFWPCFEACLKYWIMSSFINPSKSLVTWNCRIFLK